MKKILGTLTFTLVMVLGLNAQTEAATPTNEPDPNAPKIEFESETIDYGSIDQGSDGVRYFKFTNSGKTPLIITNCQGSCGCTVPECPTKEAIMPGESGEIRVKYDTKRVGPFNKTVTVKSNASNKVVYLKIKGKVKAAPQEPAFPANKDQGAPAEN